jgi:hypothetical protein
MPRPTLTDTERQARREADRQRTRQAVEALRASDGWQNWIKLRRHFKTYSLTNQLLIAIAMPHATKRPISSLRPCRAWTAATTPIGTNPTRSAHPERSRCGSASTPSRATGCAKRPDTDDERPPGRSTPPSAGRVARARPYGDASPARERPRRHDGRR